MQGGGASILRGHMPVFLICILIQRWFESGPLWAAEPQDASTGDTILRYWPIDAPRRHWELFDIARPSTAANATLSISNESLGEGKSMLWFINPGRQSTKAPNGEEFRYCRSVGRSWIFLDEYLSGNAPGQWTARPVRSSRILLTVDHRKPVDLIADSTYADCGSIGQPYLFSDDSIHQYRLQVWGHMTRNPKYRWYWDATVSKPGPITNNCLHPSRTLRAMKVQEAWWSNFASLNGNRNVAGWIGGSSGNLGAEGSPDGTNVKYFRTVWHAEGQIPYFLTGSPDGLAVRRCVDSMPMIEQTQ